MQAKIFNLAVLFVGLFACKPVSNSKALRFPDGNDFIMLAVKHIGNNCEGGHTAAASHYLSGTGGRLMLEEDRERVSDRYGFSGDAVMGRTSADAVTKMEDIEKMCRRLILVVETANNRIPDINLTKGSVPSNQQARFMKDFGNNGFGEVRCEFHPFCTFTNIKGDLGEERYFTYLEPDSTEKVIKGYLRIFSEAGTVRHGDDYGAFPAERDDVEIVYFRGSITLKGIYRASQLADTPL